MAELISALIESGQSGKRILLSLNDRDGKISVDSEKVLADKVHYQHKDEQQDDIDCEPAGRHFLSSAFRSEVHN